MNFSDYGPADRYMGAHISTDQWISLEMKRWILEHETPGRFGRYAKEAQ